MKNLKMNGQNIKHIVEKKTIFVLFLIWPFFALIKAISNYHIEVNRNIVYLFLALFGFTFVLGNEAMDSFRYALKLEQTAQLPFGQFYNIVLGLYSTETNLDIMMPLVNFIISRFTADHRILFGVWALIFGYFYLKSVNKLHAIYSIHININALFFLVLFIILNPITNINGFRMYTAAWIFFFGTYNILVNGDKKFLIVSLFSIIFHFSFISVNLVLLMYLLFGNRNKFFYILVFISFVIPEITFSYLNPLTNFLGEGIADRIARYTSDSTLATVAGRSAAAFARGAWYLYLPGLTMRYFIIIAFFYFQYKYRLLVKNQAMQNIFSFSLLFWHL
jgi:hypothetical protein